MPRMHGRIGGSSISMGSPSDISVGLKAKPNPKCAIGEWHGRYSPAPYTQLAAALTSAGDRDAANEIRYLGRVRERKTETGLAYVWSGFLQYVAGFGIGTYTFRVLWWILGFSLAGAALLWWTVPATRTKHRGKLWCFGASLARLLPVIEI